MTRPPVLDHLRHLIAHARDQRLAGIVHRDTFTTPNGHTAHVSRSCSWTCRHSSHRSGAQATFTVTLEVMQRAEGRIEPKCDRHDPVQHRDGKPPWCPNCGLTADFQQPRRAW